MTQSGSGPAPAPSVLLDANVLIGLLVAEHVHHEAAEVWVNELECGFATCPITEGSFVRLLVREGQPPSSALAVLRALSREPRHEHWPDDIPYLDVRMEGVIGHRQVTDAYLAQLARSRGTRLASFDEGLAALHDDVVVLVPTRA